MSDFYIFTEAYNCSDILKNCLKSFYKYHDDIVHVFGTKEDLDNLSEFLKIKKIEIQKGDIIDFLYSMGHMGTAAIFAESILNYSTVNNIIHFDSDVIFKKECISEIKNKLNEGFSLVGPPRPYKYNLNNRDDVRHMPDVVATCFFGFKKDKITINNFEELIQSIYGRSFNGNPIIDFFDYVSFLIMENGGKIYNFDHNSVGGPDNYGNRNNKYGELNEDIDCGDWYIHFAGIGTGSKVYKKGYEKTDINYANWALERYAVYKKLLENVEIENIKINTARYELYKKQLIIDESNI